MKNKKIVDGVHLEPIETVRVKGYYVELPRLPVVRIYSRPGHQDVRVCED